MKILVAFLAVVAAFFEIPTAQAKVKYDSYCGLVMAGYQGWFNTPNDGANRQWHHYNGSNGFRPGSCSIDFWPDVREYEKTYETEFVLKSGEKARVFSSYDQSTVKTHFRWMKEYGIDGVFLQRFVGEISNPSGRNHFDTVMKSAFGAATEYDRAVCVMYDLSGMGKKGVDILLEDAGNIMVTYRLGDREQVPGYLFHNGKPLIVVWGVGFNDNRLYGLHEAEQIIDGLHQLGYSVMLGVPTYWRTLDRDTVSDPELHRLIRKVEIIMPWFVGRYDSNSYPNIKKSIAQDISWCNREGIDYAPLCFPGFSWRNMKGADSHQIHRERGQFLWDQISGAIDCGAKMLYIAMFDEIDEGTAIFKCANKKDIPLNGNIGFEGIDDDLPSDHYLWLTGQAAGILGGKRSNHQYLPERNKKSSIRNNSN